MSDAIDPGHYMGHGGLNCHEAQRAILGQSGMIAYWRGCALKYLWRCFRKGGAQDIRKSIRCLQFMLEEMEGQSHGGTAQPAGGDPGAHG